MYKLFLAAILVTAAVADAEARAAPSTPANPRTESECLDWGRSYQQHFDAIIARARTRDERCRGFYKGEFRTVRSHCVSTVGGPVTHQHPCDEATLWTKCLWIGFQRGMRACLGRLAQSRQRQPSRPNADDPVYTLDQDDLAFLQRIATQDQFIRDLAASAEAAEVLGRLLGLVATGPVRIAHRWNQGLIAIWRKANSSLEQINKSQICDALTEHYAYTRSAHQYFDELHRARGCDER
jgi:hypothetical protein